MRSMVQTDTAVCTGKGTFTMLGTQKKEVLTEHLPEMAA